MIENQKIKPAQVIGPLGEPLTLDNLPAPGTKRWVVRRKAEVVAAVNGGLLSVDEVCERYNLTVEEFAAWQRAVDRSGMPADFTARGSLYAIPGSRLALFRPDDCGNWSIVELVQPYCAKPAGPARLTLMQRLRGDDGVACPHSYGGEPPRAYEGVRGAIAGRPFDWAPPGLLLELPAAPAKGVGDGGPTAPDATASGPHRVSEPAGILSTLAALAAGAAATAFARRRKT